MTSEPLVGTWRSLGTVSYRRELQFIDGRPDPMGVVNWLNGKGDSSIAEITPALGLTLTITPTDDFREQKQGEPDIKWFNAAGELSPNVLPFSGKLSRHNSKVYLIADNVPQWAQSPSKPKRHRYADGDTTITDLLEIKANKLVRTVNVVTDLMYFDRVIIVYQQAD